MTDLCNISAYAMPGMQITSDMVFIMVLKEFPNVDRELLPTRTRQREYVLCRSLIWAFTDMINPTKQTGSRKHSTDKLGLMFKRDHATVLHSFKTLSELYDTCKEVRKIMDELRKSLLIDDYRFEKWYKESSELRHHNYAYLN